MLDGCAAAAYMYSMPAKTMNADQDRLAKDRIVEVESAERELMRLDPALQAKVKDFIRTHARGPRS